MTHYIAGEWHLGKGEAFVSKNPVTDEVIWAGRFATSNEVDQAVLSARAAQFEWMCGAFAERLEMLKNFSTILNQNSKVLAETIAQEVGKPLWESEIEIKNAISKIDISIQAYRERTGQRSFSVRESKVVTRHHPQGVLGILGPFNFPINLPVGHIVPAVLAGNTVVFKPSELTPWVGELLLRCAAEAGFPAGVINGVQGGAQVGNELAKHAELDGLLFTGSYSTGRKLHEMWGGHPEKILVLEMGGNNPLIVHGGTSVEACVDLIIQSAYLTSGQRCTCARRLILIRNAFTEQVFEKLTAEIPAITIGNPLDQPQPFMGSLISQEAMNHLLAAQEKLIGLGARAVIPMKIYPDQNATLTPGLLDCTGLHLPDEEYFGPLLKLFWADDELDAVKIANETRYGLSASIVCEEVDLFEKIYAQLRAGILNWNRPTTGAVSEAPFGGVGYSGNHRPSAYYAADYCSYPVVSIETQPKDIASLPKLWKK